MSELLNYSTKKQLNDFSRAWLSATTFFFHYSQNDRLDITFSPKHEKRVNVLECNFYCHFVTVISLHERLKNTAILHMNGKEVFQNLIHYCKQRYSAKKKFKLIKWDQLCWSLVWELVSVFTCDTCSMNELHELIVIVRLYKWHK